MPILINDNTARVQYTATAGQTVFIVPYEFFETGDLKVYNGDTLLTYNVSPSSASQYSVAGAGVTGGGSITLGAPGATLGSIITIVRDIPIKRVTDFPNAGPFNIQALNAELDKMTAVQQNLETDLDNRVLRLGDSDTPNTLSAIPNKAARQNKLLGFDVQGQPVAYDSASLATLVAYATAFADTFTGNGSNTTFTLSGDPAVIANLDVSINGVTQVPLTDYTLSGTTLTTTTPVPNGAVMLVKYKEGLPNYSGDAQDVRYNSGFTGAVQQSVKAKLQQYVSVKDFGAVGDGVTDDTVAIQAAIDASQGKWLSGAGETYAIAASLVLKTDTLLCDATFNLTGANSAYGVAALYNENWNVAAGNTGIKVQNVTINGINLVQQSDATVITSANKGIGGIYLGYVANSSVSGCYVQDSWSGVVVTDAPTGVSLYEANNLVENCKVVRAQAWSQTGNVGRPRGILFVTGGLVSNCEAVDSATGFYLGGSSGAAMDACRAYNWFVDDGFYVLGDDLRVTNCLAYGNNFGSGFAVAYNERSVIANNIAIDCGNMGFRIHVPQSRTQFIGNTARSCGYGFRVDNASQPFPAVCDGLIVQGNIAETCNLVGFQFQQIQNSLIVGNIARNNNQSGITLPTRGAIALYAYATQNRLADNQCYDDQGAPTQTFGLYVYSAADSGAASENVGNSIDHKSVTGIDVFGPLAANVGQGFTENGPWTPVVSFTTTPGTHTYTTQVGRYLKVGNMVTLSATIVLSAKDGAAAGNLRITGLPFTPITLTGYTAVGSCMAANLDYSAGYTATHCYVQSGDANMRILQSGDNVATAQFAAAAVNNNTELYLTLTYQAA